MARSYCKDSSAYYPAIAIQLLAKLFDSLSAQCSSNTVELRGILSPTSQQVSDRHSPSHFNFPFNPRRVGNNPVSSSWLRHLYRAWITWSLPTPDLQSTCQSHESTEKLTQKMRISRLTSFSGFPFSHIRTQIIRRRPAWFPDARKIYEKTSLTSFWTDSIPETCLSYFNRVLFWLSCTRDPDSVSNTEDQRYITGCWRLTMIFMSRKFTSC